MKLELRDIGMRFDNRPVLRDVCICFEEGTVHGLVGHNGSGKSTLIKIAAGYYVPDSGAMLLDDETVPLGSPAVCYQNGLRFVHQDLGLVRQFSALENFGLAAGYDRTWIRTVNWPAQRRRLASALAMLETDLPFDRPVSEFTAVERTLLAIARAIAPGVDGGTARFLMLDEPTTALEGPETERLFSVIRTLASQRVGILYVSHQLDDVLNMTQIVTVLRDGKITATLESAEATHEQLVSAMLGAEAGQVLTRPTAHRPKRKSTHDLDGSPAVEVRGLTAHRIRNVSFSIAKGECVGAVGLSGSGREQLVYALAGAIPATVEEIRVNGVELSGLDPRACLDHRIALVPGNRLAGSLVNEFTIRENLTLGSLDTLTGFGDIVNAAEERRRTESWIERFAILPADPNYRCIHLSGGNKQKVILAKWLAIDPVLMLIDEPTAGVDVGAASSMLGTLRSLADDGHSLLITTSELSDVLPIADRILVFNRGSLVSIVGSGDPEWSETGILNAMSKAPDSADNRTKILELHVGGKEKN
ncbi:MAG: sugar ABC transporter ATP-binding protein [Actinomycetota bacterium]|nr:sugar ABC transporter ATP-binding protein [Actinomycetota bacterium]